MQHRWQDLDRVVSGDIVTVGEELDVEETDKDLHTAAAPLRQGGVHLIEELANQVRVSLEALHTYGGAHWVGDCYC